MTGPEDLLGTVLVAATQIVTVAVGGPLLLGLMRKVRSHLEGRVGPPLVQPLLDLHKLFAKQRVRPEHATWVFAAGPVVLAGSAVVVAVMAPLVTTHP
ncbi:MAG: NADH-quinone oxidoreductase subunit H, partial [Acidimicrobiales bacterium]